MRSILTITLPLYPPRIFALGPLVDLSRSFVMARSLVLIKISTITAARKGLIAAPGPDCFRSSRHGLRREGIGD